MQEPIKTYNCQDQDGSGWKIRQEEAIKLILKCFDRSKSNVPVIGDFGCGSCGIEKLLSEKTKAPFQYYGYDTNPQTASTTKIDLDSDFPSEVYFDIVVCLGLLEYIEDVPTLLKKLRKSCNFVVLSYVFNSGLYSADDLLKLEWSNHFTMEQINSFLKEAGFQWDEEDIILEKKYFLRILY